MQGAIQVLSFTFYFTFIADSDLSDNNRNNSRSRGNVQRYTTLNKKLSCRRDSARRSSLRRSRSFKVIILVPIVTSY